MKFARAKQEKERKGEGSGNEKGREDRDAKESRRVVGRDYENIGNRELVRENEEVEWSGED